MTEIFEAVKNTAADLEAEPVLRFAELAASLLSWTLMASAYRGNYDGLYEYSNYTPLNFLLATALLQPLGGGAARRRAAEQAALVDRVLSLIHI